MRVARSARRTRLAALVVTTVAAGGLFALTPTAQGSPPPSAADAAVRVHWAKGKALTARSDKAPAGVVRGYVAGHGADRAAADGLRQTGPAWRSGGVRFLRMEQYAGGLRVADSFAKAAFDAKGRLVALVENTSKASAPRAARASDADALRAAIGKLYANRRVDTRRTSEAGNVSTFARQGFSVAPTVERVAVPMDDSLLSVGYVVTTWDRENQLNETLVAGDGNVVRSVLRTASDSYNIFPEHPEAGDQVLTPGPGAGNAESPAGWLAGPQWTNHINGNNAEAYLDLNNDNDPDPNQTPVTNGVFGADFNPDIQPSAGDNPDVAVQNLFFFNNLIHDTLYRAGFNEAAGNFQEENFGEGGKDSDPVQAEAQDGGSIDNANFATPNDGQDPRMQMYLWSVPGTHQVLVGGQTFDAAAAEWPPALTAAGQTGPLVLANDGTGTTSDACESLPAAAGAIVIADRGTCNFTVKADNAEAAGAVGLIVANNVAGTPFTMGGDGQAHLPSVMVSQADGAAIKAQVGQTTTIRLTDPPPILKDGDLDSDIIWHEYGHGLTWRMIGLMFGPMSGAVGEGMSDVLSVIANDDPVVGEYSTSDPLGVRTASYEGYPRTYGDIVGAQVHLDGEVYGAIGWDLWKNYKAAGLGRDAILADLVGGMNFTPMKPTFEEMRDGILMNLAASGRGARACMVWDSFAQYGVGVGAVGKVIGKRIVVSESFAVPASCD